MSIFNKEHMPVILAFLLPLVLILVIVLVTYLPNKFVSTDYNFVYSQCVNSDQYYECSRYSGTRYEVENGKLVKRTVEINPDLYPYYNDAEARLFLHDTQKNESREIPFSEAQELRFSGLLTSPDGASVQGDYSRSAEIFPIYYGGTDYGYYLKRGNDKKELNIYGSDSRYTSRGSLNFVGWVLPGRINTD